VQEAQPKAGASPLVIPADLLGADAPPITLPKDREARRRAVRELYPPIPPLPVLPQPAPGPEGHPLTLADLQRLGDVYSPTIKNALAAVEAAKGAAYQAGQYPNPTIAYEHDTVETGPAGYPGFFFDQVIKTAGKLTVAQAAATMDIFTAQLALRRARSDLWYNIRTNYFAVLVAQENIRVSEALFRFTNQVYTVQVNLVEGGEGAGYEPMQLRPVVMQAQLNLIQAQNQYQASWRQLASSLGLPDMPPSELVGRVDVPVPVFDYNDVLGRLRNHTDVLSAVVAVDKAKFNLKLQKLTPFPDIDVRLLVQKDFSTPPNQIAHSAQVAATIPLWDQNKGAIRQAEWLLAQASVGPDQARNALITSLADAFNRYQTARRSVDINGRQIRDQVRAYRGLYERWQQLPGQVGFGDLVTAEQTLSGYITAYVTALGQQWQATVDVANLLQTEDLFNSSPQVQEMILVPDMKCLMPPPAPIAPDHHPLLHPQAGPCAPGCQGGSSCADSATSRIVVSGGTPAGPPAIPRGLPASLPAAVPAPPDAPRSSKQDQP
jgi:cobalt-zinc-cadmium efflux system outer membrane protein